MFFLVVSRRTCRIHPRNVPHRASETRRLHASRSTHKGILDKINPFKRDGPSSAAAAKACPPVKKCDDVVSLGGVQIPMYGFGTWQVSPSLVAIVDRLVSSFAVLEVLRQVGLLVRPDDDVFSSKALANAPTTASNDVLTSKQLHQPYVEGAIEYALETGIRHFDTSITFKNLEDIGGALDKLSKCGAFCRDEIFISGKLPYYEMKPEKVNGVVQKYLGLLKTDYLDLFMIHYPVGVDLEDGCDGNFFVDPKTDHLAIWEAMEKMVEGGCVKSLGLSNFKICQIEKILNCAKIKPVNLQIELHVYNQECELVRFACCHGISVTAYAPLGSYHLRNHLFEISGTDNNVGNPLDDPAIERISRKHCKTAANILLRFLLQKGIIVIPKSEKPDRICSNFNVFDFELDGCDMEELEALDRGKYGKMFNNNVWQKTDLHPEYPFVKT